MSAQAADERHLHPVEAEWTLHGLVLAALDCDDPNPKAIAETVAAKLTQDELRAVALLLLPEYVRKVDAARHQQLAKRDPQDGEQSTSRKWAKAAEAHQSGRLEFLRRRVNPNGESKFFGDCTAADLEALIAHREKTAQGALEWAERYRKVAAAMKRRKTATVAALPASDLVRLEGLFHGA